MQEKNTFTKIILSGSSSVDLTIKAVKYLVGRIFIFTLYPLSFPEYIRFKNIDLYRSIINKENNNLTVSEELNSLIMPYFNDFLLYGGYSRIALCENNEEKLTVLKNIYNTYLLRDVKDLINIVDDYKLKLLIKTFSLQIGNIISYNKLSSITGLSFDTLKNTSISWKKLSYSKE